jgi:MFS family permease
VLDEWWSYLPAGTIEDQRLDLGITYTQAGWLLALLTLGGLIGAPLGALADRGHRRLLAVGGAAVLALGLATFALGAPFIALAIASAAMGGASDVIIRPIEASLAEIATEGFDKQLGRMHSITWAGDFIGPALLALGAATFIGWRGVFAITAAVFVAYAIVLAATEFPDPPDSAGDDADSTSLWRSSRRLATMPEVLLLTAAEFILLPLDEAFLGFAVAQRRTEGIGAAAQLLAGGIVVGGITGSALIARRGISRAFIRTGAIAMMAGAGGAALPSAITLQIAAMATLGFGTAIVWAKVHHRMLTIVPGRAATVPTVIGLLSTPSLLVPTLMGSVSDRISINAALAMTAALTIPLAVVVLRLGGDRITADELDDS